MLNAKCGGGHFSSYGFFPSGLILHSSFCILHSMFDALKNLGSLPGLMAKAREMQEKMQAMQEEMARRQVSAEAAGGMVEATVNGRLELVWVRIDKTKIDPADTEMLEDVIVAAVRAAQQKAAEMMQAEMQKTAGEMGLPPGLLP
jgi:nucleoid-associated protein EbfC